MEPITTLMNFIKEEIKPHGTTYEDRDEAKPFGERDYMMKIVLP